jgi:hypothetical protein
MPVIFATALLLSMFGQVLGFGLGSEVLVARDAALAVCVAYCFTRIRDYAFLLLASGALGLLCIAAIADIVFRGGDVGNAVSAIRNVFSLVAIPVIAHVRPSVAEQARWSLFSRACLRLAFLGFCLVLLVETVFAAVVPALYALADAVAQAFLESKGVLANTEAGIFGLPRMRTLILNPVQGAWFLLMLWIALPVRHLWDSTVLLAGLALTVAKVAGGGLVVWAFMRTNSVAARAIIALAGAVGLSVLILSGLGQSDGAGTHVASGLLHLEGLMSGVLHGLQHPLGAGFSSVGLAAARGAGEITPGMESFVGSTVAALGWIGIALIGISAMLFLAGDSFSRALGAVVLAGIMISDNVASLYLYAPLLLRPFAFNFGREGTTAPAADTVFRRGNESAHWTTDDQNGLRNVET